MKNIFQASALSIVLKLTFTWFLWAFSSGAFAGPYELSYGGRLTESSGKPVVGPVSLRVTFFRSASGNDLVAVTLADFSGVTLTDGIFQVPISLSATDFHTLFNGVDPAFIQVEDLTHAVTYPRQKFSAVPYALKVPVDGESITFNAAGQLSLGNGSNTLKLPNTTGAANKVLKSDGTGALIWADDLSGGGAGSITTTEIQDGTLTNADISATAAIATSKISGLGSLATKSAVGSSDITDGSVTGTDIANGTITDASINATANISYLKISGLGSAASKNVGTAAGDVAAGNHTHADATTGASGFMSAGDKVRLNAAVVTTDTGTVTGTMIAGTTITNANVSTTAAIAGTKITPDFGSQNIVTTGTITGNGSGLTNLPTAGTSGGAASNPSSGCPTGYILVPGDTAFGTTDFCVMKYEAKFGKKGAESRASGLPARGVIAQADAIAYCRNLGPGYALINNMEWMTIATNLANVASNWSGGAVGSGALNRGHSDNAPTAPLAATTDDNDACSGTGQTCSSSVWDGQRRTHTLSNGNVVWDFAGNVWEWVDYLNYEDKPGNTVAWVEYSALSGTTTMPKSELVPTNAVKSWWSDSWNSTQNIGKIFPGANGSDGALCRGGDWSYGTGVGVFTANMNNEPSFVATSVGFRCVFRKAQ